MGLIEYYIIFALATACACCYEFFWPTIEEARVLGVQNEFTEYPVLSAIIYIGISTIVAPILVIPLLSTKSGERFRNGLRNTIVHDK